MEDGAIVYIDYDLFIVDTGDLIETTRSEVAKEHDQLDENKTYEPLIVTVGEGSLIEGFENHLKEAESDTDYEFDIPPEEAYGERDANAVETFSEGKLALLIGGKEVENLRVGGPVTVEGKQGTIKMFAAGRARVDFNHPLAGRTLHYDYRITKVVEDLEEKVHTILNGGGLRGGVRRRRREHHHSGVPRLRPELGHGQVRHHPRPARQRRGGHHPLHRGAQEARGR
ncbi:MAG: hypothetical protein CXX72_02765 [Methanobacteriota archaeon]|nr:MAG: hypothetical protein CXX72_02765 [Euryarchaeota archaeon]